MARVVRFRDEILRGLRLGAIFLAVFIASVAAYRITHEAPAVAAKREAPEPAAPTPRAPQPDFGDPDGPHLPPPPPVARKKRVDPPVTAPVEVESKPPEVASPPAPEHEVAVEPARPEPPPQKIEAPEDPDPVAPVTKPEARPKRWLRAVGRFLHVVRAAPEN